MRDPRRTSWTGTSRRRVRISSGWPTITYVATWAGFLYLAIVLDAWSRRIVGWAMETHLRTELALKALDTLPAEKMAEVCTALAVATRCGP